MILYIAEKPSLGRAIAEALPAPHSRGDGFIRVGGGDVVSWCIGHLLELAEPEAYDPAFKQWAQQHLPIVPERWQLREKPQTARQLGVLRRLVGQADVLVHAGDPDREGQLLVDEVIAYLGVTPSRRAAVKRCLISDLNPPAVKKALASLRDNRDFAPLSTSALARSRADWLYGINMTRAYTLQGRRAGYRGVLSVGRVQTPLLGLVVRRDADIAQFISKPFYEVWANLVTERDEAFRARWVPSEHCARFLDEEGRNLSRALADNVAARVSMQPAQVTAVERKLKTLAPPLPHNLSALQIDANRRCGLSAQQVLDACQALYEKHKAITYPRSDCRYLPSEHFHQAGELVATIKGNLQRLGCGDCDAAYPQLDLRNRTKAWNDARVQAHHAIIPTSKPLRQLSERESQVYGLVCRNYLAQFLPDHQYRDIRADIAIQSGHFVATAKQVTRPGWKILFGAPEGGEREAAGDGAGLPALQAGQPLRSLQADVVEKHTAPPKHFTEATLLAAMTGIAAFVRDAELKKILRQTDGLGTEATRAGIIELLFRRGFLVRQGKTVRATELGRALIEALPPAATLPDMTARWESTLSSISQRQASYDHLMAPLVAQLHELIAQCGAGAPLQVAGMPAPTATRGKKGRGAGRKKTAGRKAGRRVPTPDPMA